MTIRVLVVDDHAVVRSGLRHVLEAEDDIEVVAEAGDLREAVFEARAHKPDVILMDVVMPGASGIEATPAVLKEAKDAKVLMLSMQDDPRYVREAFAVGASGYVLKEAADAEVVDAVREVANGGRYVHPALGARLIQAEVEERAQAEEDPLSEREREVLRLLALGHTNQEIAKMLYLSVRTVETHRAHIMQKLRLTTRAELVRYAHRPGPSGGARRIAAGLRLFRNEMRAVTEGEARRRVDDSAHVELCRDLAARRSCDALGPPRAGSAWPRVRRSGSDRGGLGDGRLRRSARGAGRSLAR